MKKRYAYRKEFTRKDSVFDESYHFERTKKSVFYKFKLVNEYIE